MKSKGFRNKDDPVYQTLMSLFENDKSFYMMMLKMDLIAQYLRLGSQK